MDFAIQSITVKTEIIQNMPIVMPKRERNVLNLLTKTELMAIINPSLRSLNLIPYLFALFIWMSKIGKSFVKMKEGFYSLIFTIFLY